MEETKPDSEDVTVSGVGERVITWRTASSHQDMFVGFLRKFYFPFLLKTCKMIPLLWLVLVIIGMKVGTQFLSATSSDTVFPKGTPSETANNLYVEKFPNLST